MSTDSPDGKSTPSEVLSRAADLIRDTAALALAPPWFASARSVMRGRDEDHEVALTPTTTTARWIALLSPAVAPMIEYWLRTVAEHCERPGGNHHPIGCPVCAPALKLSRVILGEEVNDG